MIEMILDNLPWFWFVLTVFLTIIEGFTMALTTIWFALGALVLIPLSFLPLPFSVQVLLFLLISGSFLFFTRPFAIKKLHIGKEKTNIDSLIGASALVVKTITKFEKGEVKLQGNIWTAKTENETELVEGSECTIVRIEGVTAIVK
jgi:membrane protein implicated in regulation of membrane protease activity